jgi:hypothetical protein
MQQEDAASGAVLTRERSRSCGPDTRARDFAELVQGKSTFRTGFRLGSERMASVAVPLLRCSGNCNQPVLRRTTDNPSKPGQDPSDQRYHCEPKNRQREKEAVHCARV